MTDSIDRLVRAVRDKGTNPAYHDQELGRLATDWPELYGAVIEVVRDRENRRI